MKPIILAAGAVGAFVSGISGLAIDPAKPAVAVRLHRPDPPDWDQAGGHNDTSQGDGLDVPVGGNRKTGGPVEDDGLDYTAPVHTKTMMRHQPVCSWRWEFFATRFHFVIPDGMRFSAPGHGCGFSYYDVIKPTCEPIESNWQCTADGQDGTLTFGITVRTQCDERMMAGMINKVTGRNYQVQLPCVPGDWGEARDAFKDSVVEMVEDPWNPGHWIERSTFESQKNKTKQVYPKTIQPPPPLT